MALTDSGMSMVLAVDAGIFRRRAEGPLKTAPAAGCIVDLEIDGVTISDIRMRPDIARFKVEDGRVLFSFGITLRARLAFLPFEAEGELLVALDARPAGTDNRSLELMLAYERFALQDGILVPDQEEALDDIVRAIVEPLLVGVIEPVALGGILPDGAALVSPVLIKMIPEFGSIGSTLLIGLEVDTDADVNRNRFRDDFTTDLLAGGTADWRLEIDSELVRQRAAATLAGLDLTENAPDGRGIENWVATTSTGVLWSGDPISINTHGQSGYILEHYDEHPIWFVVEGFYDTGLSVALESRAVGHADLVVDADAGDVMVVPHIFHAGWLFFEIQIEDQPAPVPIMDTAVGGGLEIHQLAFDSSRLSIIGLDDHPGMPGDPTLLTVEELRVNFKPSEPGRLCKFSPGEGEMRPDGTVVARSGLANTGDAPLWICGLEIAGDDPAFSVRGEAADPAEDIDLQFPARVDPGNPLRFMVLMQVPEGDHAEHHTELVVRSNDFDRPRVTIPVSGRKHPPAGPAGMEMLDDQHRRLLCMGRPELLPPREWFDAVTGMVRDIGSLVNERLPADALADLTMSGLPPDAGVVVRGHNGQPVGLTSAVGGLHQLTVPLDQPDRLRFEQVGGRSRGPDNVMLALGRLEPVLNYEGPGRPGAAIEAGGVLFAAFGDGVHLVPLERGRASAILPLRSPDEIDAAAGWLFVRNEEGVELFDVGAPDAPRHVKTMAITRDGAFRALPRHLLIMERSSLRVYGLTPGTLPVLQGEVRAPGPLSLVVPWQRGVALLGESGGLIGASLEVKDLAKAGHIRREALPPMLRLMWETRVDDRTSLPVSWQRSHLLRIEQQGVRVMERNPGEVRFSGDAVAAFLDKHGAGR